MAYLEFTFNLDPYQPYQEILIAQLGEIGFESFVEESPLVKAYIPEEDFQVNELEQLSIFSMPTIQMDYTQKLIPKENWNKKWEESFEPIEIDNFCLIRAPFHSSNPSFKHELVIEPKMSFGTGHHATTQMMVKQMDEIEFKAKHVLDMGSGTGVLAILAEKLGADNVIAIDIDEWAYENIQENIERNNCHKVQAYQGGQEKLESLGQAYDIVLANINKNILFEQLPLYLKLMKPESTLVLSGFFTTDVEDFEEYFANQKLKDFKLLEKESWACIKIKR